MEAIKQIIPLLLTLSLAGLVVSVGLNSTRQDLLYVLSRPALLFKAILAVDVIPIVAAIALTFFLPLEPVVKAGIMLMAISPVPPLIPGQALGAGGRKQYAYGLYVAMALLTVIVVPVGVAIAAHVFGGAASVTFLTMAKTVATGVLIPLAIGMAIRALAPAFAAKAMPWVYRLSMLLVVLVFLPLVAAIWPAIVKLIGNGTLLAIVAAVLITLVGGHLLGGPETEDRATLAIASSVRHPGIAMMLANANFDDKRITAAVLLVTLVSLILGIPYKQWIKHSAPHPTAAKVA